jgi:glycosyltransferase involved in cell wall biosynthesis
MIHISTSFCKDYSFDGVSLEICEMLFNYKVPFCLSSLCNLEEKYYPYAEKYGAAIPSEDDIILLMNPACFLHYYHPNKNTIIFTVWDSSILPIKYVNDINKARMCIVPSKATKDCFVNSGVNIPIEVIPLWYDPRIFNPIGTDFETKGRRSYFNECKFGASGLVTSEKNDKKDLNKVVSAFKKAFDNKEKYPKVSLELKVTPESKISHEISDSRIKLIKSHFTQKQLSDWYRDLSCYVNLSKYESFGKQPMEAIACGIPIITTNHSGISDYYSDDMGYTVGHKVIDANCEPYTEGEWFEANEDEVISRMRQVYHERQSASHLGEDSSHKIKHLQDHYIHQKLIQLLKRFTYV